jgi:DNA mismatch repair protein MutH
VPTEAELIARAIALSGRTIEEVASARGLPLPTSGHKGYVGALIERALDLTPHAGPGPDVPALGLEVKTTPIDRRGAPRESTFVGMVPREGLDRGWAESATRAKLARVLFVPVEAEGPLLARRIGSAFVWQPSPREEAALAADWDELTGLLRAHGQEHISARHGQVMQVRPKAARASSRWRAVDEDGAPIQALPRAFYLRRSFVASILSSSGLCGPEENP